VIEEQKRRQADAGVDEVCDKDTGEPFVNTYLDVGDSVAVVAMRRRDVWDSETGLRSLGPGHFGWPDFPYRPVEELAGKKT
jgi:DUF917 family protein